MLKWRRRRGAGGRAVAISNQHGDGEIGGG
jgi:hypothetical protein